MAKQTVTHTHTKATVSIKAKAPASDRMRCNVCGGTGYQKKPSHKKKK